MNWTCKPFRDLCAGKPCYIQAPGVVCADPATVVPCHSNLLRHGHGAGLKAHDAFVAPGCAHCHTWLDHGPAARAEKERVFMAAWERWILFILIRGEIAVSRAREGILVVTDRELARRSRSKTKAKLGGGRVARVSPTAAPNKQVPRSTA
jgi:hypothetical protein